MNLYFYFIGLFIRAVFILFWATTLLVPIFVYLPSRVSWVF